MELIQNIVAWFASIPPQGYFVAFLGGSLGLTGLGLIRAKRKISNLKRSCEILHENLIKERELNKEKKHGNRPKTPNLHRENSKSIDRTADIEFCKELLEKNYMRYANDPTTIDLTLEALSNEKLSAMQSVVEKNPDPVCQNIAPKVQALQAVRGISR